MQHILRLEKMPTGFEPVGLVDCLQPGIDLAKAARARAQELLTICRQRKAVFGADRMTDPYWEILLHTFSADEPVSHDAICGELDLPPGIVARWIAIAESDGLIRPASGFILASYVMTDKGQSMMVRSLT